MTTIPRVAQAELEEKFNDVQCNEVGVAARFTGTLSSIAGGQNKRKSMTGISRLIRQMGEKVGALAEAQVQGVEEAADVELAAWSVTREQAIEGWIL